MVPSPHSLRQARIVPVLLLLLLQSSIGLCSKLLDTPSALRRSLAATEVSKQRNEDAAGLQATYLRSRKKNKAASGLEAYPSVTARIMNVLSRRRAENDNGDDNSAAQPTENNPEIETPPLGGEGGNNPGQVGEIEDFTGNTITETLGAGEGPPKNQNPNDPNGVPAVPVLYDNNNQQQQQQQNPPNGSGGNFPSPLGQQLPPQSPAQKQQPPTTQQQQQQQQQQPVQQQQQQQQQQQPPAQQQQQQSPEQQQQQQPGTGNNEPGGTTAPPADLPETVPNNNTVAATTPDPGSFVATTTAAPAETTTTETATTTVAPPPTTTTTTTTATTTAPNDDLWNDDDITPNTDDNTNPSNKNDDDDAGVVTPEDLKEEERRVRFMSAAGLVFALLAMVFTAYQMSENPDGIYAAMCRLCITAFVCMIRLLLSPCKGIFGYSSARHSAHHYGHMPISTMDYGYRNDPSVELQLQ